MSSAKSRAKNDTATLPMPATSTADTDAAVENEEYIADFHAFFRDKVGLPVKDDRIARSMVLSHHIPSASDLSYLLFHSADLTNRGLGQEALTDCVKNPIWIGRTKEYLSSHPNE